MSSLVPALMFPALFLLVFAGLPVAFSLVIVAVFAGWFAFGDNIVLQLYGPLLSSASNFVLAAIPLFVFMGAVLERSGVALRLYKALQVWLGGLPGGIAVATIAMCAVFAAASGVVGAVEIVVGLMAIPAMQRYRYSSSLVAGTICAGGSLGTIIPPSIVVVVYASVAQLSIGELFAATLLPGLIMVGLFLLYVIGHCLLFPQDGPRVAREELAIPLARKLAITLRGLVPALALIGAVLGSLLGGVASPTEAAAVGAFGALVLAVVYGEFSLPLLRDSLTATIKITAMIMLIVVGGTMFTSTFAVTGGSRLISTLTLGMGLSETGLILVLLLIVFVAGFVLDWISIVLICIPIFTPLVKAAGIDPVWFAVMVMVVIQTSYLTPPMAPSIFYLRSIAPRDMTYRHMYLGVLPFVLMQLVTLLVVALMPATATWLPSLLVGLR